MDKSERLLDYEHITQPDQLAQFCDEVADAEIIAFDTEFVSEHRYRPQLCLVQVAAGERLAIIDTLAVPDIRPFWDLICEGEGVTIAHAAREEFLFCYRDCGKRPKNLFDVQLAAAFVGLDYPAAYSSLAGQILSKSVAKDETRTDWRQRPLSKRQLHYALQDVQFLEAMYRALQKKLKELGRVDWYREEIDRWQAGLESMEAESQWRRLPGLAKLNRRALAVVRQIYQWREDVARHQERSPRRIVPDDLVIEIAKRGEFDLQRLKAVRGLTQRINERFLPAIAEQVKTAMQLPDKSLPERTKTPPTLSLGLLGQFLTTALGLVCLERRLAPSLVATVQDIRDLAAWKMGMVDEKHTPFLLTGWRSEIIGQTIDDVIHGKLALRVSDPHAPNPIKLERWK